jgi:hypothetical protein
MVGQRAEHFDRKGFLPSEIGAITRAYEPIERAAAKERQAASGGKGRIASGKLPEAIKGQSRDKVAA